MTLLGEPPASERRRGQWLHHIGVIAAYRDQHKVTTDDPRQVLGPYAEPGHAGHRAYWHAAESVIAARHLAGLSAAPQPDPVTAQIAADIYRALPHGERALIAAQPPYAAVLATALAQAGYLPISTRAHQPAPVPLETGLAARRRPRSGQQIHRGPEPSHPDPIQAQQPEPDRATPDRLHAGRQMFPPAAHAMRK